MRTGRAAVVAGLLAAALGGCAPSPVVELDPATAPPAQLEAETERFVALMTDLYVRFLVDDADRQAPSIVSPDSSVPAAVGELAAALGLDSQAEDFAVATAVELERRSDAVSATGDATGVTIEVRDADVVGERHSRTVAAVTLLHRTEYESGPITEEIVTYAVGWYGGALSIVEPYLQDGRTYGLDSGVGLGSPTGAVRRFVELTAAGDWAAVETLSGGANVNETDLAVLQSVLQAVPRYRLVDLPQFAMAGTRLVYAINDAGIVVGRFEANLTDPTSVVYVPTA